MMLPFGSSPLARGAPAWMARASRISGLIPARAGRTKIGVGLPDRAWAHPRSRGAHGHYLEPALRQWGSSPLARGARRGVGPRGEFEGLIPARAGRTHKAWTR